MIRLPTGGDRTKTITSIAGLVGTGSSVAIIIYILTLYKDILPEDRNGFIIVLVILTISGFVGQIIDIFLNKKQKDDTTVLTSIQDIDIDRDIVTLQIPRQRIIIAYKPETSPTGGDMGSTIWKETIIKTDDGKQTET